MMTSLLAPALVLGLWSWVSGMVVPASRLAESTIPHMIAAREIAGSTGRYLMGAVVLCGTASVVNGLLLALPRKAVGAASLMLPLITSHRARWLKRAAILIPGLSIAGMLLGGMAGEPVLEVLVRAGILFWLLGYVLVNASALFHSRRQRHSPPDSALRVCSWGAGFALVILVFVLIILVTADPERGVLTGFMLSAAGVAFLSSSLLLWISGSWS